MSGMGDHRFIFVGFACKLHILHKSDNIVHWVFAYRICDKPDNIQFMKSREKYVASFDAGLTSNGISFN